MRYGNLWRGEVKINELRVIAAIIVLCQRLLPAVYDDDGSCDENFFLVEISLGNLWTMKRNFWYSQQNLKILQENSRKFVILTRKTFVFSAKTSLNHRKLHAIAIESYFHRRQRSNFWNKCQWNCDFSLKQSTKKKIDSNQTFIFINSHPKPQKKNTSSSFETKKCLCIFNSNWLRLGSRKSIQWWTAESWRRTSSEGKHSC